MSNQSSWDTYTFRCSGLPHLMTNGRGKELGPGETAKVHLLDIWISERFGRQNFDTVNKYTKKGIMVESDSLELVSKFTEKKLFKNIESLTNEYLKGTPDIIKPELRDIKSSWDVRTFFQVSEAKAIDSYYWQMMGYMFLTGQDKATLTYVLVDTPPELAEGDLYRMSFNLTDDQIDQARKNYTFSDIPEEMRIKEFTIYRDESAIERMCERVFQAREFLKQLDKTNGII